MIILPILFLIFSTHYSSAELCHPKDKAALLAFKHSFSYPANPFATWDPIFDCCTWYGVQCDETTNYVTGLDIAPYEDLNGTIPSSLGDLQHLTVLRLHKIPNLVGEIPPKIGDLLNLRSLTISWTNISGPIPSFLANLKSLVLLDLSFNRLSGSIPPILTTLPYLRGFDFSRNQLTGPIPESFGHIPVTAEFPVLDLSHNKLSGELPASLANVNFSSVDISRNNLSGDASVFFGKGKATSTIDISRNNLLFGVSKYVRKARRNQRNCNVEASVEHFLLKKNLPSQCARVLWQSSPKIQLQHLNKEHSNIQVLSQGNRWNSLLLKKEKKMSNMLMPFQKF